MAILFPSDEWVQELMAVVNASEEYAKAAENWEGDLFFVVERGAGLPEDHYLYMDLWHGECRSAGEFSPGEKSPEFEIRAPLATWRQVLEGKLDPIRGLTTRRLKLKGNLMKVMKSPRAALALVECAREIDTRYPR
ncbi:MAG: SCP2 sterol-binding domain-containing protein [Candidatus Promineifilaceae bacterium]|nr:SCP2 sterol-binding domain-containing protein [Candidatus Promineifilaceae bacterium]